MLRARPAGHRPGAGRTARRTARIRRTTPRDAPAICSVLRRSFAEYEAQYTPRAFAATILSTEGVLRRMEEGPIWVGLIRRRIVATASARITPEGLHVRGMGVAPEARGRRLGWRLLERIEQFARRNGLGRMYLSTTPFLARAIRLYEAYGFRRNRAGPFELLGTALFTMARDVTPGGGARAGARAAAMRRG